MAVQRMTIVIGAETFPPDVNGAAKFGVRLGAGLSERGHRVVIVAPSPDKEFGFRKETHEGIEFEVYRLRSWKWFNHPWVRFALPWEVNRDSAAILDEVKPDAVHIQSHINVGWGIARQAHKRGIRLVATNHFMPENAAQFVPIPQFMITLLVRMLWAFARKTYSRCDAVTTPTARAADYLENAVKISGVSAISCGLNVSNYRPVMGKRAEPYALFVGRVEQEKHIEELLFATNRFTATELRVVIAGWGDDRERLEKIVRERGLADRVTFAGLVDDAQLVQLLSDAAVFVMPSTAELQSIATMEAMASGLPVVAANAMALPHLVHDGQNGFLYEPRDIDGLERGLRSVLESGTDRYIAMQKASLSIVAAHDIATTLDRFEAIYRGA
jgi:glycosyltransferase involved in cell wall biosynthesis